MNTDKLVYEMSPLMAQYVLGAAVSVALSIILWGSSFILWISPLTPNLRQLGLEFCWVHGRIRTARKRPNTVFLLGAAQLVFHAAGSWLTAFLIGYQLIVHLWNWAFSPSDVKEARGKLLNQQLSKEESLQALYVIHENQSLGPTVQRLKDNKPLQHSNNWFLFLRKKNSKDAAA